MSKIKAFIQPEIEVFVNLNGHVAISQDQSEDVGTYADQLIVIHPSNIERFVELIREAGLESRKILEEDFE